MKKELLILLLILLAKAAVMLALIVNGPIGLGPDEAQYWTWAQKIDWGYYSKPPGIAWEIWLGTALAGNTVLGVRLMPLVIGFLLPLLIYGTARRCEISPMNAMLAATAFALTPIGILSSLFAITDGGMLLFWTTCLLYLAGTIQHKVPPNYLMVGALIGLGALFKWPCYLLWPLIAAAWIVCPTLRSPKILLGIALSLLALLPSIYWNTTHDWATFKHVSSTVSGGHGRAAGIFAGNPLEFLGSQLAIVSPILFILVAISLVTALRQGRSLPPAIRLCLWITLAIFFIGIVLSFFMKVQGNWAITAYPSAFVVLGWALERFRKVFRWSTVAGATLSVLLTAAIFTIPTLQSHSIPIASLEIPYQGNIFRHNIGWENLAEVLTEAGYNPETDNLISDKYQTVSVLSFYGPQQHRAYFFNLMGIRRNQFSYWPGINPTKRKKSFFVVVENSPHLEKDGLAEGYLAKLQPYFGSVKYLGMYPLFSAYSTTRKGALLFECLDFTGTYPEEPQIF